MREWNLRYLRDRIGVVSQEPTLFAATVAENIAHGRPDTQSPPSREEICDAARDASAVSATILAYPRVRRHQSHAVIAVQDEFIMRLPKGYDSLVGTSVSTTQLSGGQRREYTSVVDLRCLSYRNVSIPVHRAHLHRACCYPQAFSLAS